MKSYFAIGLMSGTSLDGVDLVYVSFDVSEGYSYKIICAETIPYSHLWKNKLQQAFYFNKEELQQLSKEYALLLSKLILDFKQNNNIKKVDFIASHGHTIHHQPEKGYTLQIGNGQTIFNQTKIKTICDFRTQDVKLSGQGAPLVPIGDALLFKEYDYCLNLGGFANISFDKIGNRLAFDICPVNIVMNYFANKLGIQYDDKGKIAKSGSINSALLNELNAMDFYQVNKPKSLGFEFVQQSVLPLINEYDISIKDILHTYVEHIAIQIALKVSEDKKLFITGGGAFNLFLIERIAFYSKANIILPDAVTINFKEALIFAFLGLRRLQNKVNCLQSVTGASKNHSSGEIFG